MADLHIALKGVYFDAIKRGEKTEEYRLISNQHWCRRLRGRNYDRLILTKGYPRKDDHERRIVVPYNGYEIKTITHEHFGPDPVKVFAIKVTQ